MHPVGCSLSLCSIFQAILLVHQHRPILQFFVTFPGLEPQHVVDCLTSSRIVNCPAFAKHYRHQPRIQIFSDGLATPSLNRNWLHLHTLSHQCCSLPSTVLKFRNAALYSVAASQCQSWTTQWLLCFAQPFFGFQELADDSASASSIQLSALSGLSRPRTVKADDCE